MTAKLYWTAALVGSFLWTASLAAQDAKSKHDEILDSVVLELVLTDILSNPNSPIEPKTQIGKQIIFSTAALTHQLQEAQILRMNDEKQLRKLSAAQLAGVHEAANHIIRRIENEDKFTGFIPLDARISIYTKKQDEADKNVCFGNRPQVFYAYSPGYSKDQNVAVVRLSFSWSGNMHEAESLYILAKSKGKWKVLLRDYIHFV